MEQQYKKGDVVRILSEKEIPYTTEIEEDEKRFLGKIYIVDDVTENGALVIKEDEVFVLLQS